MPQCLSCLRETPDLTDEHVFPAVIGGTLVVAGSTCAECNNGFSPIEQWFAGKTAHFRWILGISDRKGNLPTVPITMQIEGRELKGKLQPDGSYRMAPTIVRSDQGRVVEAIHELQTAVDHESLRQKLKPGWEVVEEQNPARQAEVSMSGDLDFLDSDKTLRLVTKIALTALAFKCGKTFALSGAFSEARDFVRSGSPFEGARIFLNQTLLTESPHGLHHHSVVIAGRKDQNSVVAVVRLFGGLSYFVELSNHYDGADFSCSLVLDAHHGEENRMFVSRMDTEFQQLELVRTSPDTVWNDQGALGRAFLASFDQAIQRISEAKSAHGGASPG